MSKQYNLKNKKMVEETLKTSIPARNDDVYGAILTNLKNFPAKHFDTPQGKAVLLSDLKKFPINPENFKRIRAKFNEPKNGYMYLATDEEVLKARGQLSKEVPKKLDEMFPDQE